MICKICGENHLVHIGNPRINKNVLRITKKNYKIFQCDNCQFYQVNPEIDLTQKEWSILYGDDYFATANTSKWQEDLHYSERISRIDLMKKYSLQKIDKFLDFGCGEGFVLREALKQGFEPCGVDIADNLDDSVNRNQIQFFNGNIFDANYQDDCFSAIYMDSILEHTPDPISVLKELNRILKVNGVMFLIVPNEDSLMNDIKKFLYTITFNKEKYGRIKPFFSPYHIQGFNRKSLKFAVEHSGFRLLQLSEFGGNYTFWKAYKTFSKPFIREILLYPFGLLSISIKRQIQLQAIFTK